MTLALDVFIAQLVDVQSDVGRLVARLVQVRADQRGRPEAGGTVLSPKVAVGRSSSRTLPLSASSSAQLGFLDADCETPGVLPDGRLNGEVPWPEDDRLSGKARPGRACRYQPHLGTTRPR